MKTFEYIISGMTCAECADTIENSLSVEGIDKVSIDYSSGKGIVTFDEKIITKEKIVNIIDSTGHYKVISFDSFSQGNTEHLIILGGGSAAFAATIRAHELGVKVTMINDDLPIGGTCVNVGCVPSKNLIRAANSIFMTNHNPFSGVATKANIVDFKTLIFEKDQLVQNLREEKYINIVKDMSNFKLIKGRAKIVSGNSVSVNNEIIEGTHILIATGSKAMIPSIKGLNSVSYLTSKEAFELEALPKSIIIIGGSYIALEMAQLFSRLGSKVTVLQRSNHILSHELSDISDELSKHFRDENIKIVTGNDIKRIEQGDNGVIVHSEVDGVKKKFYAQEIIIATGREPNTKDIGLRELNIALEKNGGIKVNKFLQTSVKSIYAAGDVLGSNMFVYAAAYEGKIAVENAFSSNMKAVDYKVLPWVIFTDPQIAGLGMDEVQAKKEGFDVDTAILPLRYVPRCIVAKDTRGFIKLVRNKNDDTLIGARIIAPEGSELLMQIAVTIRFGITIKELKELLYPYLTLSEGIKLAAITFDKDISELSCCAT